MDHVTVLHVHPSSLLNCKLLESSCCLKSLSVKHLWILSPGNPKIQTDQRQWKSLCSIWQALLQMQGALSVCVGGHMSVSVYTWIYLDTKGGQKKRKVIVAGTWESTKAGKVRHLSPGGNECQVAVIKRMKKGKCSTFWERSLVIIKLA